MIGIRHAGSFFNRGRHPGAFPARQDVLRFTVSLLISENTQATNGRAEAKGQFGRCPIQVLPDQGCPAAARIYDFHVSA